MMPPLVIGYTNIVSFSRLTAAVIVRGLIHAQRPQIGLLASFKMGLVRSWRISLIRSVMRGYGHVLRVPYIGRAMGIYSVVLSVVLQASSVVIITALRLVQLLRQPLRRQ